MEQGTNILPLFVTGLVMMLIGWAMGFFDSNLRTEKKIKQAQGAAETAINESKSRVVQAEAKLAAMAANAGYPDNPGLLRVKNENGHLSLDLDGVSINTASMTAEQRKRLVDLLTQLRPWLEGKPVNIPSSAQPMSAEEALRGAFTAPPTPIASSSTAPVTPEVVLKEERLAAPAGSIVEQIDTILQTRLLGTALGNRGIYLAQSLEGGVVVYVGTTAFNGVDEVADPEVKAAIRGAIQEWENKYTPGL